MKWCLVQVLLEASACFGSFGSFGHTVVAMHEDVVVDVHMMQLVVVACGDATNSIDGSKHEKDASYNFRLIQMAAIYIFPSVNDY